MVEAAGVEPASGTDPRRRLRVYPQNYDVDRIPGPTLSQRWKRLWLDYLSSPPAAPRHRFRTIQVVTRPKRQPWHGRSDGYLLTKQRERSACCCWHLKFAHGFNGGRSIPRHATSVYTAPSKPFRPQDWVGPQAGQPLERIRRAQGSAPRWHVGETDAQAGTSPARGPSAKRVGPPTNPSSMFKEHRPFARRPALVKEARGPRRSRARARAPG